MSRDGSHSFCRLGGSRGGGVRRELGTARWNITGLTIDASPEMFAKNLGLLTELVPRLSRLGVLRQADRGVGGFAELEATARRLNVALHVGDIRSVDELAGAFATMTGKRVGAVIVAGPVFYLRRQQVADLALKHRVSAWPAG